MAWLPSPTSSTWPPISTNPWARHRPPRPKPPIPPRLSKPAIQSTSKANTGNRRGTSRITGTPADSFFVICEIGSPGRLRRRMTAAAHDARKTAQAIFARVRDGPVIHPRMDPVHQHIPLMARDNLTLLRLSSGRPDEQVEIVPLVFVNKRSHRTIGQIIQPSAFEGK